MKHIIHNIINKSGYLLLNRGFMPFGISLERDISRNTEISMMKNIFDIGANKGLMSLYFNAAFKPCTIYAFEPVNDTFQQLSQNTKHINNIKPYKIGFSDHKGNARVYLQSDSGLNSFNDSVNVPDKSLMEKVEIVALETVDEFCSGNNISSIDLLKTDTEGLDLKVLKGAENIIKSGKVKYILSEVGFNDDNKRNTPFEELRAYLYDLGYKLRGFYHQSDYGNKPYLTCANALFLLQGKK